MPTCAYYDDSLRSSGQYGNFYSKIVGYSSGCDRLADSTCKGNSEAYYIIEQNYFGIGWGARGYSRVWGTALDDTFATSQCDEIPDRDKCGFWAVKVNMSDYKTRLPRSVHAAAAAAAATSARNRAAGRRSDRSSGGSGSGSGGGSGSVVRRPQAPYPAPYPCAPHGAVCTPSVFNNTCPDGGTVCGTLDGTRKITQCPDHAINGGTTMEVCPPTQAPNICPSYVVKVNVDPNCQGKHCKKENHTVHEWICPSLPDMHSQYGYQCCAGPGYLDNYGLTYQACAVLCGPHEPPFPQGACYTPGQACRSGP